MNPTITLSENTFKLLTQRAAQIKRAPGELAEEVLKAHLFPPHPYVELVQTIAGERPMIKGTHIPVSIVVGCLQAGETPESLANEVMPHVPLAAIHDALSYYHDHQAEIDQERQENSEDATRQYLRDRLGEVAYRRMVGLGE
jgi:uncharacterized protein (DUF433 family)